RQAIVNRLSFNNAGAATLADRLRRTGRPAVLIGISLDKSKRTPLGEAVEDYSASYRMVRDFRDDCRVNVSSPNTPGLRSLQDREHLAALLDALVGEGRPPRPILVKIAPDLTESAIAELLGVCLDRGAAGVIATNTTVDHDEGQAGGLS